MLKVLTRKAISVPALVVGFVMAMAGVASATTADPVSSGFTAIQGNLTTYLGYAVVLVVAVAAIAIGIRLLVRWAKRAASA